MNHPSQSKLLARRLLITPLVAALCALGILAPLAAANAQDVLNDFRAHGKLVDKHCYASLQKAIAEVPSTQREYTALSHAVNRELAQPEPAACHKGGGFPIGWTILAIVIAALLVGGEIAMRKHRKANGGPRDGQDADAKAPDRSEDDAS